MPSCTATNLEKIDMEKKPIKIMFVCHGNICRSPMAEFVLRDMAEKAGRGEEFFIRSSAVSAEEIWGDVGNPVYKPVKALLAEIGISCEGKRAEQLTAKHGEEYDYLLCMDTSNIRRAKQIVGGRYEFKVQRLLDFVGIGGDVADPWYTRDFNATYRDIAQACEIILEKL